MPRPQTATVANYGFGGANTLTEVGRWQALSGVRMQLKIAAYEVPITISIKVSADAVTWNATTSAANVSAVTSVVIPAYTSYDVDVLLRQGTDNWVQLLAMGGGKLDFQVREDAALQPVVVGLSQINGANNNTVVMTV